jgi:hypothetical protein
MFRWINKQGVEFKKEYTLQRMHRFFYHYIEKDHILKINVDPGLKHEEILFNPDCQWEEPYQCEDVSADKLSLIRSNVSKALKFMKIAHKIRK